MKLKCNHCKCKDSYQLTRVAYDDMEYLGEHKVKCKCCYSVCEEASELLCEYRDCILKTEIDL